MTEPTPPPSLDLTPNGSKFGCLGYLVGGPLCGIVAIATVGTHPGIAVLAVVAGVVGLPLLGMKLDER